MLVLTRESGDVVVIMVEGEEHIYVKIVGVRGGKVRLGFQAPRHINIVREEIIGNAKETA